MANLEIWDLSVMRDKFWGQFRNLKLFEGLRGIYHFFVYKTPFFYSGVFSSPICVLQPISSFPNPLPLTASSYYPPTTPLLSFVHVTAHTLVILSPSRAKPLPSFSLRRHWLCEMALGISTFVLPPCALSCL